MNDKTKTSEAGAKKIKNTVDPTATAPSNNPNSEEATSTATEPNSRERVGLKQASRTGRGNGSGEASGYARSGLNQDLTPDDLGERKEVSPATTDVIWTNDSKDRWDNGQPAMADLLKQRHSVEEKLSKG